MADDELALAGIGRAAVTVRHWKRTAQLFTLRRFTQLRLERRPVNVPRATTRFPDERECVNVTSPAV